MPPLAPALLEAVPGLTLLHQAARATRDLTRAAYEASGADPARWRVEAFLDNMAGAVCRGHLVMARSGASTVAELAAAGKAALLIPFAAAADDHQRGNAEVMVQAGAAVMIEERQLGSRKFCLKRFVDCSQIPASCNRWPAGPSSGASRSG
jgi:UDP-N-acetylglucosamine--N-acetylmuramyl-(pentapeptide) pyrophosphoryl-undecaprenol N-acetylglucosamine transferase